MENFKAILSSINNQSGIVHIYHKLFGGKKYICEKIHIICDEYRMGVAIHGCDIYMPINDIKKLQYDKKMFVIKSDKQEIKIILKKL